MKKVLDANCFQDPLLEEYLHASPENRVVFTDFACMETYKPASIASIHKSLSIVSRYPAQVVVLKPTPTIIALQDKRPSASTAEFTDDEQTRGFAAFCEGVRRAAEGDARYGRQIEALRLEALAHFDTMLDEAKGFHESVAAVRASLRPEHVRALRERAPLSREDAQEMIRNIVLLAGFMFANHPMTTRIPQPFDVASKTHIFRMALANYLLTVRWIGDGGAAGVRPERLRNDAVDMTYVAYATRYDGLLSLDKKMVELYEEARFILDESIGGDTEATREPGE